LDARTFSHNIGLQSGVGPQEDKILAIPDDADETVTHLNDKNVSSDGNKY
jgi:hypothetical protein